MNNKSYKFKFDMCDLAFVSYTHKPLESYVSSRPPLQEIIQTIPLINLLNPSEEFTLVYVFYKSFDIITGTGYLSSKSSNSFRGMFTVSQRITNLLAENLFKGINNCNVKETLNGSEKVFSLNNQDGKIVEFNLILENGILIIESV